MTPIEVWQNGKLINTVPVGGKYVLGERGGTFISTENGFSQTDAAPIMAPREYNDGDSFRVDQNTTLVAKSSSKI